MLVDKKRFKELKREAGGISKLLCTMTVNILEAPELKKIDKCNFNIYSNGLYLDFIWGYRLYFSKEELYQITNNKNVIEILLSDGGIIKIEAPSEKYFMKINKVLSTSLGITISCKEYDRSTAFPKEVMKERKILELEKKKEERKLAEDERKKEMEKLRNAGRTVSPYKQPNYQPVQDNNVARCPKCGSTSLTANKKGFSATKGVIGLAVSPLAGAVVGSTGKNKVIVTCLKCGHQWKAGKK